MALAQGPRLAWEAPGPSPETQALAKALLPAPHRIIVEVHCKRCSKVIGGATVHFSADQKRLLGVTLSDGRRLETAVVLRFDRFNDFAAFLAPDDLRERKERNKRRQIWWALADPHTLPEWLPMWCAKDTKRPALSRDQLMDLIARSLGPDDRDAKCEMQTIHV